MRLVYNETDKRASLSVGGGGNTSLRTEDLPWEINEKSSKGFKQENDLITLNVSFCLVSCSFYHGVQLAASSRWASLYVHTDSNHSGNSMGKALTICNANFLLTPIPFQGLSVSGYKLGEC